VGTAIAFDAPDEPMFHSFEGLLLSSSVKKELEILLRFLFRR